MRISDWSSDVCSSDLLDIKSGANLSSMDSSMAPALTAAAASAHALGLPQRVVTSARDSQHTRGSLHPEGKRSEEHTSELQSLMRISYAVFCLQKKNTNKQ